MPWHRAQESVVLLWSLSSGGSTRDVRSPLEARRRETGLQVIVLNLENSMWERSCVHGTRKKTPPWSKVLLHEGWFSARRAE